MLQRLVGMANKNNFGLPNYLIYAFFFVKPKIIMIRIDCGLSFNGFDIFVWVAHFLCDKY